MSGKGGAFRPAPLSCRYCRVPHDLIIEAHADGLPNTWAVLLMLTSYIRDEGEAVLVCCSRGIIADALGITEQQVTHAVEALKRKGIIETPKGRQRTGCDIQARRSWFGFRTRTNQSWFGFWNGRGGSWFGFQSGTNSGGRHPRPRRK